MLTITDVLAAPAVGAFFFDDQAAIRAGAPHDGFAIVGEPLTPGFAAIRQPAEAVSVMVRLSDGHVAHGDCVSVQYSGVGGREPLLRAAELRVPRIEGRLRFAVSPLRAFRELSALLDALGLGRAGGVRALAGAARGRGARQRHQHGPHDPGRMGAPETPLTRVPVYAQCGEQRYENVDKMILREVDSLPHGLINHPSLVGSHGETLVAYVKWVSERVQRLRRRPEYAPVLHFDVYGVVGMVCDDVAEVLVAMEEAARPFALRVEHPLDAGSREGQIEQLAHLRQRLRGSRVQLVADEWANTLEDIRAFNRAGAADMIQIKTPDLGGLHHSVEAVLDCKAHGVLAHLGGSCCETDRAARTCVHVALATGADQILAKPGMGVDEGLSIVTNEMARTLRLDDRD